jgi:hypothetical protein
LPELSTATASYRFVSYLIANNKIEDILDYNKINLNVQTDKVLELIKAGTQGWEECVPDEVAGNDQKAAACLVIPAK